MQALKSYYPIIATGLFVLFILIAHLVAAQNYDWTKHTISNLASQGYDYKIIMQIGFILFGLVLIVGVLLNPLTWRTIPIFIYGLSIAISGIFCTKPFEGTETYSVMESNLHSTFAQLAGISFSIGILIQMFFETDKSFKLHHLLFFILVIGFSATFGLIHQFQGIIQRILYIVSLIWLIRYYKV